MSCTSICETARDILRGPHEVGRVIARPFIGEPGSFTRTANRHDYAVPPPRGMLLDATRVGAAFPCAALGKIVDIFLGRGISAYEKTKSNAEGMQKTLDAMGEQAGRTDLHQPGRLRHAVRPPQRCRRLRSGARGSGRVDSATRVGAGAGRSCHFYGRSRVRPDHSFHRPQPRVRAAARLWSVRCAAASIWACARRFPTLDKRWRRISEHRSSTVGAFSAKLRSDLPFRSRSLLNNGLRT